MNKQPEIKPLEPDAAGVFALDKEAKVMLLQILKDGIYTKDMGQQLARKLGAQTLVFVKYESKVPESAICENGLKALEAKCRNCNLVAGCFYWREYGKGLTRDADMLAMLETKPQD